MGTVSRIAERRWRRLRSEHARTLEGLQSAMRAHPATRRRPPPRPAPFRGVTVVPADGDDAA